jgi:enoyl-CoA hydratase/carnithine racemase
MSRIYLEFSNVTAILRIQDPTTRNALSHGLLDELFTAIERLETSRNVTCVVITGSDGVFAAGANIGELTSLSVQSALEFARRGQELFARIYNSKKLYIAAIDGYCMGGGLDLALSCEFRYASPVSSFAHPGPRLGIITGWGGTQLLPRVIGRSASLELLLTGRRIKASEALAKGLITRIVDDPVSAAVDAASHLPLSL